MLPPVLKHAGIVISFPMLAFSLPANAARIDIGNPTFANAQRKIALHEEGNSKEATLMRICGNASYEMREYDTYNTRWMFRIRFLQDASGEDEFAVLRNGQKVSGPDAAGLSCVAKTETDDCAFIERVLLQYLVD
ncbi:hypothetical protein [Ruegeria atlantica]|uniref:Uncharacterized protein n=1 Tax=Ruegeria atlantica TaxID=81569 RepID=A0A0P1E619_9RHOB|nr:hypothetical protein [Ruegeria atlantica]CUH42939.1 hypothetical protein RUM4293_01828 [Ruegeria atlantica]